MMTEINHRLHRISWAPFMLVKPEGGRHLTRIRSYLAICSIAIESVFFIEDWEKLSRELYRKQLAAYEESEVMNFEAHVIANHKLYNNHGLILILSPPLGKGNDGIREILASKEKLRTEINDGTIEVVVNIGNGRHGHLDKNIAKQNRTPLALSRYKPTMNYVHTPDCLSNLKEEYEILSNFGILNNSNLIAWDEFDLLCKLQTTKVPSKVMGVHLHPEK